MLVGLRARLAVTMTACSIAWLVTSLAAGCSQLLDVREPIVRDDAGVPDGTSPNDGPDPDAADIPRLWLFTTNGVYDGDLGSTNGGRATADARCDEMYQFAYMKRQCSQIHAVLQVDNVTDTLNAMATTFQIPSDRPVARAVDAVKLADHWADVVDRTVDLQAPVVSSSTTPVYFWSGRGTTGNRQCTGWKSTDPGLLGDAGDATKTTSWLAQMAFTCDSLAPHLMCVCW